MTLLNKLTIKNLKLNKKRTLVTVIGILLSVALITAVSSMFVSARASLISFETTEKGNYHYSFLDVNKKDLSIFTENRKIEEVYPVDDLGYAYLEGSKNEYKPYVNVKAFTEEGLHNLGVQIQEGRLPENDSEILVPAHVKTNGRVTIKVGETLSFDLGTRMAQGEVLSQKNPFEMLGEEEIVDTQRKQYTVVGIMNRLPGTIEDYEAPGYTFVTCETQENMGEVVDVYAKYNKDGVKDHLAVTAHLLEVDENAFSILYNEKVVSEYTEDELNELTEEMGEPKYDFGQNEYLIMLQSGIFNADQLSSLGMVVLIVILIIITTSVYCIKNSFDISISEKITQYGMLSSVGATRKQIRRNVYYEAMLLGTMGIPLGILSGLFAAYVLVHVSNYFLDGFLNVEMIFEASWVVIVFAVLLGILTILLSARSSAVKAAKISPIQAIRNSEEIKIRHGSMKTPKFISRLFGIGGEVAYKNLKRSKKKYRTTVVSIVMSVSVFIALSSFVNLAFDYTEKEFQDYDYNISISYDMEAGAEGSEKAREVARIDGIKKYSHRFLVNGVLEMPEYSREYLETIATQEEREEETKDWLNVWVLDEGSFRDYTEELGLDYDVVKEKGILLNDAFVYLYNQNGETYVEKQMAEFDCKENDVFQITFPLEMDESGTIIKKSEDCAVEIAKIAEKKPIGMGNYAGEAMLIVGETYWEKLEPLSHRGYLFIDAEDPDKMQDEIEKICGDDSDYFYVNNIEESKRMMESFYTLLAIFLYGFIIVIALIGVTNIFNTITTNMNLRRREFATLKSVGMTRAEFNRMIRLESLFYGTKSLLIGIPIGCLLSYFICRALNAGNTVWKYRVPVQAILLSAFAVFLLIAVIMWYSVQKIQKQNIIETIRNENI